MRSLFDDGKDDGALRTIGEVCDALQIKAHVLRYWEAQFPALKPLKRSGGRRYYRPEDVQLVRQINRLVNEQGYTIKGARAALEGGDAPTHSAHDTVAAAPATAAIAQPAPADAIAKLKAIRARLAGAIDA